MKPRLIDRPGHGSDKAEGDCVGFPYNTELASADGVTIHFWIRDWDPVVVLTLLAVANLHRDIVGCTYSSGEPIDYWAHEDIGKRGELKDT